MSKKVRIRCKRGWIGYPGSTIQQNYAEPIEHGYLLWDINERDSFNVTFKGLPNPRPFVTIDWDGSTKTMLETVRQFPKGTRFRIRSNEHISYKDSLNIKKFLIDDHGASEITYKIESARQPRHNFISAGETIIRDDLRNADVLYRLLQHFYKSSDISDNEWSNFLDKLKIYASNLVGDITPHNVTWSLRRFKFDNLYAYGKDNVIDVDKKSGIIGIFGNNRSGKSSIPGSLMYSLFNDTDRGKIKNRDICNIRQPYCVAKTYMTVNTVDYVVERQTVKSENKHGDINTSTALNLFRIDDKGNAHDLAGEARVDTDKMIRTLIGNADDFKLTSFAAQGDMHKFIDQGPTRRWDIISRFLDMDIFKRIFEQARSEVNANKALLKKMPEKDFVALRNDVETSLKDCTDELESSAKHLCDLRQELTDVRSLLSQHTSTDVVTSEQITDQERIVANLHKQLLVAQKKYSDLMTSFVSLENEICDLSSREHDDVVELRNQLDSITSLESSLQQSQHTYENECVTLDRVKRSLVLLSQVPCGDEYPKCKFIKDAHLNKNKKTEQEQRVEEAGKLVQQLEESLKGLDKNAIKGRLDGQQKLSKRLTEAMSDRDTQKMNLENVRLRLNDAKRRENDATTRLSELNDAYNNLENLDVNVLRKRVDQLKLTISNIESNRMKIAERKGSYVQRLKRLLSDEQNRNEILHDLKLCELLQHAFSKKGIPNLLISEELPLINQEITKILNGIVDFTIELERDLENDNIDIYINYDDSRRIVELASGMEKMIASLALRVALINVSTLPKTDMLIIDEGFGVLDAAGIDACSRLLVSLKHYFRLIVIITHVDSVKDIADYVIEITKDEKDAKVVFQ